jgi:MoaA/NifB/PqqE/SkfB family radical SAM enzyme
VLSPAGLRFPSRAARHVTLRIAARLGAKVVEQIPFFILKVTDVCNARCTTCSLGLPLAYRSSASMPRELALRVVKQMAAQGALFAGIVGGEPLLYRHLFETLALCREHGIRTNLNTHGGLLTAEVARELAAVGLSYASISLDYADPARNDAIRRGVSFDSVLRAIRAMRSESPDTAISIGMTLTRQSIDAMTPLCELAAREGVRYVKFQPFHAHLDQIVSGTSDPRASMSLEPEDMPRLHEALRAVHRARGRLQVLTNARVLERELAAAVAGVRTLPCVAGRAILFVDPSGRAGGCPEKRSRGSLAHTDLATLLAAEPEVFRFADRCPRLSSCFDTTYGELSHLHNRHDLGRALDVVDRVRFYR